LSADRGEKLSSDPSFIESLFWGGIEVSSFAFLFLSPYLGEEAVRLGWVSLVLWRVMAVSGRLFYDRNLSGSAVSRARLVTTACLYGLPFWTASLFFPLRAGQVEVIGQSLLLFLLSVLLCYALSFLRTHWLPGLASVLTFLWFQQGVPWGLSYAPLLLGVVPFFWPKRDGGGRGFDENAVSVGVFLASAGWALSLCLGALGQPFGLTPLSRAILLWMLIAGVGAVLLGRARCDQQERSSEREVELSLPALKPALSWMYSQELKRFALPWLAFVPLALWGADLWFLALSTLLAIPGLLGLASRLSTTDSQVQWWYCSQFVLLWGMTESYGASRWAWLLLSALLSWSLCRAEVGESLGDSLEPTRGQAELERELTDGLFTPAPKHLLGEILKKPEPSVEIDESLVSVAPSGFRERLLERLKQSGSTEEEGD